LLPLCNLFLEAFRGVFLTSFFLTMLLSHFFVAVFLVYTRGPQCGVSSLSPRSNLAQHVTCTFRLAVPCPPPFDPLFPPLLPAKVLAILPIGESLSYVVFKPPKFFLRSRRVMSISTPPILPLVGNFLPCHILVHYFFLLLWTESRCPWLFSSPQFPQKLPVVWPWVAKKPFFFLFVNIHLPPRASEDIKVFFHPAGVSPGRGFRLRLPPRSVGLVTIWKCIDGSHFDAPHVALVFVRGDTFSVAPNRPPFFFWPMGR